MYQLDYENGHLMITVWQMDKHSYLKSWHFCTSPKIENTYIWTGIFTSNLQNHPSFSPLEKNVLGLVTNISLHASTKRMRVNSKQSYDTRLLTTMKNVYLIWTNRFSLFTICILRKMVIRFINTSKYFDYHYIFTLDTYCQNILSLIILIYQYWNRYPIEERRKLNIYRNPHVIPEKDFFYMTGNSLENYWTTVDFAMQDGIDDSMTLSLPSKVLLFFIRLRKNKTFRWTKTIIYILQFSLQGTV